MANTQMERCPEPCNCKTSTGICGSITRGTGRLDEFGYWQFPCTHGNAYSDYEPSTPAAPETPRYPNLKQNAFEAIGEYNAMKKRGKKWPPKVEAETPRKEEA